MDEVPNEILEDGISLNPDNRLPDTTDPPNEELPFDSDADNPVTTSSNEDIPENVISDTTEDLQVSPDLTDPIPEKGHGDIPVVTAQIETAQDTYSLDDIYQSLERSREIQSETRKISEHGNRLLEISNSIGISIIFAIALVLGVLIGRVVWRKI